MHTHLDASFSSSKARIAAIENGKTPARQYKNKVVPINQSIALAMAATNRIPTIIAALTSNITSAGIIVNTTDGIAVALYIKVCSHSKFRFSPMLTNIPPNIAPPTIKIYGFDRANSTKFTFKAKLFLNCIISFEVALKI